MCKKKWTRVLPRTCRKSTVISCILPSNLKKIILNSWQPISCDTLDTSVSSRIYNPTASGFKISSCWRHFCNVSLNRWLPQCGIRVTSRVATDWGRQEWVCKVTGIKLGRNVQSLFAPYRRRPASPLGLATTHPERNQHLATLPLRNRSAPLEPGHTAIFYTRYGASSNKLT